MKRVQGRVMRSGGKRVIKINGDGFRIYISGNVWRLVFSPEKVQALDSLVEIDKARIEYRFSESVHVTDAISRTIRQLVTKVLSEAVTTTDSGYFQSLAEYNFGSPEQAFSEDSVAMTSADLETIEATEETGEATDDYSLTEFPLVQYHMSEEATASDEVSYTVYLLEVIRLEDVAVVQELQIRDAPDPSGQYMIRTYQVLERVYSGDSYVRSELYPFYEGESADVTEELELDIVAVITENLSETSVASDALSAVANSDFVGADIMSIVIYLDTPTVHTEEMNNGTASTDTWCVHSDDFNSGTTAMDLASIHRGLLQSGTAKSVKVI